MTLGIGTDIEDTNKFKNLTLDHDYNFLKKIYTDNELNYCFSRKNSFLSLAGRFVGKEAIYKGLCSIGINSINLTDIEIINNDNGVPQASILKVIPDEIKIKVSISHCEDKAIAFAIIEK